MGTPLLQGVMTALFGCGDWMEPYSIRLLDIKAESSPLIFIQMDSHSSRRVRTELSKSGRLTALNWQLSKAIPITLTELPLAPTDSLLPQLAWTAQSNFGSGIMPSHLESPATGFFPR